MADHSEGRKKMTKRNLKVLILSSVFCCLPIIIGLALWDRLPQKIPNHWNLQGEVDGFASKPVAVFVLPLVLLLILWLCALGTIADKRNKSQNPKLFSIVFFTIPALSNLISALTYITALGKKVPAASIIVIFMGTLFTFIGNYMPKCKQNYTIGIKIPSTLNSEKNWNATHRFAGKVWTIGGILTVLLGFLPEKYLVFIFIVFTALVIVPIAFSLIYQKREGDLSDECDKD